MTIRFATIDDIPAMHECRDAAIREKCSAVYPVEMVEALLTNGNEEIFAKDRETMASGEWIYLISEEDGRIYGIASFSPAQKILGRLYTRRGIKAPLGEILLNDILRLCRAQNCPYLDFSSSLNAQEFYERHGAVLTEKFMYKTKSGIEVPSVKMRLSLIGEPG